MRISDWSSDVCSSDLHIMPHPQRWLKKATSRLRLGLFSRSFLLLAALMLVSLGAWLQVFFSMEEGPRAAQMAQRVTPAVRSAERRVGKGCGSKCRSWWVP